MTDLTFRAPVEKAETTEAKAEEKKEPEVKLTKDELVLLQ